jgi:AraC-like DNA-binding protein
MNTEGGAEWARVAAERDAVSARALADEARYSVAQYYRKFRKELGETPVELRRRLRLERAAFELTRTGAPIASVAFRAGFTAAETFCRAFRRRFGVAPGQYRRLGATDYRLPAPSQIHFAPAPSGEDPQQGELSMNVIDRLLGAHYEGMKMILDRCEGLTDEELDRPVAGYYDPLPWMSQTQTLRSLLRHTTGASDAPTDGVSLPHFRAALEASYRELKESVATYEREKMWDLTFVDAECDPAMVFSYGGWIGHVLLFHGYRRIACLMALDQLGQPPLKFFDPIDFSEAAAPVLPG